MKIFSWGYIGQYECIIADTAEEAWKKVSDDMKSQLGEDGESDCDGVNIVDGKFMSYSVWEF